MWSFPAGCGTGGTEGASVSDTIRYSHTFAELVQRGEILFVPGDGRPAVMCRLKPGCRKKPFCAQCRRKEHTTLADGNCGPVSPDGLTSGQQAASRLILESTDRLWPFRAMPVWGKPHSFAVSWRAGHVAGRAAAGCGGAGTHARAVSEMQGVGVKAQTIASFLWTRSDVSMAVSSLTSQKRCSYR